MSNHETNPNVSQDDATSFYHKGPRTSSHGPNGTSIVDDYSRFSWVSFLGEKSDTFNAFKILFLWLMHENNKQLKKAIRIRSDHGKEFENSNFTKFCNQYGIYIP